MGKLSFMDKLLDGVEVEWLPASEIFYIKNGYTPSKSKKEFWENGNIPWFRLEDIRINGRELHDAIQHVNSLGVKGDLFPKNSIFMSTTATIGEYALVTTPHLTNQQITNFSLSDRFSHLINIKYVFYKFYDFGKWCEENSNKSGGISIIGIKKLSQYSFPIPCPDNPKKSLAIQAKIVRILDAFTALTNELTNELKLRKLQYQYYRDKLLSFKEEKTHLPFLDKLMDGVKIKHMLLNEITQYEQPTKYLVTKTNYNDTFATPVLTAGKTFILGYTDEINGIYKASKNPTIIFDDFTTARKWVAFDFKAKSSAMKMISSSDKNRFLLKYVYYWMNTLPSELTDGDHKRQWIGNFSKKKIPIPCPDNPEKSLTIQAEIVRILDEFDTLTHSMTNGLPHEIELRQKQYEYYRDQLFNFPKKKQLT